jgi:hypothetical protein
MLETQIDFIGHFDLERIATGADNAFVKYLCHTKDGKSFRNVEYLRIKTHGPARKDVGADLPKSPVMLNLQFKGAQPIDVFVVPWAGGQTDPLPRLCRTISFRTPASKLQQSVASTV